MLSAVRDGIYLHYAFDLWSHAWRRKRAAGDVIVIRYADDIVLGLDIAKSDFCLV